jgi:hypothetical protein
MWALEVGNPFVLSSIGVDAGERLLEQAGSQLSDADFRVRN